MKRQNIVDFRRPWRAVFAAAGLLLLPLTAAATSAELNASLQPETVAAGENFNLVLTAPGNEVPQLLEAPDKFTFRGRSQSTRIINGKGETSVYYTFAAAEPGEYTLPPLKAKLGATETRTPPLRLLVKPAEELKLPGQNDIFARGNLGVTERQTCYVGEEIPLQIQVFWPENADMRLELDYPRLDVGKSVLRDFRAVNPERPEFAPPEQGRVRNGETIFNRVTFNTAFRPLAPGKLELKAIVPVNMLVGEKSDRSPSGFDAIFNRTNYRRIPRQLAVALPELTVKTLPPRAAGELYVGLIGDYQLESTLSGATVEAGDAVTLTVRITGRGSMETLDAPTLKLPDCRVYPAEVKRAPRAGGQLQEVTLRYVIIPLKSATMPLDFKFVTFNPESGVYALHEIRHTLTVTPATKPLSAATAQDFAPAETREDVTAEPAGKPRTTLLYLKKAPAGAVATPLWHNNLLWLILLILVGPVGFAVTELRYRRQQALAADPDALRKGRAGKRYREVCRAVAEAPDCELPRIAAESVTPYLADSWRLAPGATIREVADHARDPELADALRKLGDAGYLPAGIAAAEPMDHDRLRKTILRGLRKYTLWLLFLVTGVLASSATAAPPAMEPVKNWDGALAAFDQGQFAAGRDFFKDYLARHGNDPAALYNLGCMYHELDDPSRALWCFERAALLAPMDSAIRENQNVLRRKFFLPERGQADHPAALVKTVRDRLRPDHYWLLLAVLWSAGWLLAAGRRKLGGNTVIITATVLMLAGVLTLAAIFTQYADSYRSDRALIVGKSTKLRTLPGAQNGKVAGELAPGSPVTVTERRGGFTMVATPELEGWVPNSALGSLDQ